MKREKESGFRSNAARMRKVLAILLPLACIAAACLSASAQTFTRVTNELCFAQSDAGAFVWFDFDDDGWADVLCSGGWRGGYGNRLFHNNRDGTFTQVEETHFAGGAAHTSWATVADFNEDGLLDVIAGNAVFSPASNPGDQNPLLFINQGSGRFTKALLDRSAILGGIDARAYTVTALDYNGDGFVDVALGRSDLPNRSYLLRNTGQGAFAAVTNTAWTLQATFFETICSVDYDGDGMPDLLGFGGTRLLPFRNAGGGNFVLATNSLLYNFQVGHPSLNSAWGDFDNDGDLDVAITYVSDASKDLQVFLNDGSGNFTLGFSAAAVCQNVSCTDYDNDGKLDLYATGFNSRSHLYRNLGGAFTEVPNEAPVQDSFGQWPMAAWGDYNNDGFPDLLVGATGSVNALYRNTTNGNHWLKVKLAGQTSNRAAIGAVVRVKATIGGQEVWQMRVVQAQSGLADVVPHFGLGDATNVTTLRIEWPSGTVQELANVAPDQILTIIEPRRPVLAVAVTPTLVTGTLVGDTNQVYQVHVADDLAAGWTVLTNVTTDASGAASWADPGPAPQDRRFYKGVKTP